MTVIAVLTNLPDSASAINLAGQLLRTRLAACVNILAPATSCYRWEGREEQATEHPVLIKTTQANYPALEEAIRRAHPYDVPEIIALPVVAGLPVYLGWVEAECNPPERQPPSP